MKSPVLEACADCCESGGPEGGGLGFCREGEGVLVVAELVDAAEDPLYDLLCEGSHWRTR